MSNSSCNYGEQPNLNVVPTRKDIFETKLYKRRFLVLFLYGLCSTANGFMWIQFSILTSIMICYYHEKVEIINLTVLIFNILFIPLVIPAAWMMNVKGLRFTVIFGVTGSTLAACIQLLSLHPNKFYVVLICQVVSAVSQSCTLSVPPLIAALWFGPKEVSRACGMASWFNQLGNALGMLIPPLLVPANCSDTNAIYYGLKSLALLVVVYNFIVFVAVIIWFEDRPKIAPSIAQAKKVSELKLSTSKSACKIIKNKDFVLLMIVNGLIQAVIISIQPLLNQMIVKTFPGKEVEAGWIGFETICTGMLGSVFSGYILDKTGKFRRSSIISNACSLLILVIYTSVASVKVLELHFLVFGLLGFILMTYSTIGFQYAAEVTYPEPEAVSSCILVGFLSITVIFTTAIGSWLQQSYSSLHSNLFFCGCVTVSTVLSFFIRDSMKRSVQDESTPAQDFSVQNYASISCSI